MSVPTTTDGCNGGRLLGSLSSQSAGGFASNDVVQIAVHGQLCVEVPIAEDGSFVTGALAPFDDYGVNFAGELADGHPGVWGTQAAVCSDDIEVTGVVVDVPVDSGS